MRDTVTQADKLVLEGVTSGYGPIAIIRDLSLTIRRAKSLR